MKKLFVYLFAAAALSLSACKGNNKTGGDQADSGATNVGSSGAADTSAAVSTATTPAQTGTSGTDTSGNGKGTTNPTADTLKTNSK
ncbi:hypothetical protein ABIB62_000593 [Mucilaginibacter sp. UYP25]|uniref:hypothetical protein n=1 Tax=unclassified Mucilaginibacter TaxID=2617802 RepID=UPI003395A374